MDIWLLVQLLRLQFIFAGLFADGGGGDGGVVLEDDEPIVAGGVFEELLFFFEGLEGVEVVGHEPG